MCWVNIAFTTATVCTLAGMAGCSGQTNNPLVRQQPSILANLPYRPFMPLPDGQVNGQSDSQPAVSAAYPPPANSSGPQTATGGSSAGEARGAAANQNTASASLGGDNETGEGTADQGTPAGATATGFPAHISGTHHAVANPPAAPLAIPDIQPVTTGTYSFTLPHNVSSFKKFGDTLQEYLLYYGIPHPNQKPFLTMVVAAHVRPACVGNPLFRVHSNRTFILNRLSAREYTGYTAAGMPFAELILSHGNHGDRLDALAVVPNNTQRKTALKILASIHFKAN